MIKTDTDRSLLAELNKQDIKDQETDLEILKTQAEVSEKVSVYFSQWVDNTAAISVTIGAAILPLTSIANSTAKASGYSQLGAAILIFAGIISIAMRKHRLEKAALDYSLLGYQYRAVIAERRQLLSKYVNKSINQAELAENYDKGNLELSNKDIEAPSDKPSIESDLYLLGLITGIGLIIHDFISKEYITQYWILFLGGIMVYVLYVFNLVLAVIKNNRKRRAYIERIEAASS